MTCEATVDLRPLYLPRHSVPAPRSWDWTRRLLPAARFIGGLLLDLTVCAATFAVTLVVASAAVDLYLQWRR